MKNLIKLLIVLLLVSCGSTKQIKENVFQHPIYPSCENVSVERYKKCFSQNITKDIVKHFDMNLVKGLGIGAGKKRIMVNIRVDKKGKINVISVDAPHLIFEEEVRRVIGHLPLVKPGLLNGLPINVKYGLPITFNVW